MSEQSPPIIVIDNVHKSYLMGKEAVPALRGVSLTIRRGEMVCLMGPSGSGKTTLLNLIGGLDEPGRGHVTIDGADVVAMSEEKLARLRLEKLGFVFQTFNLLQNFTAQENVESPMVLLGKLSSKARRERAKAILQAVGLADRAHHYPSELSGGQQQRVAIARALANDPAILIGDEMTGDLDSKTGFEVMAVVRDLNQREGKTVVYVTHDPRMAEYADYTVHLLDGVMVDQGEDPVRSLVGGQRGLPPTSVPNPTTATATAGTATTSTTATAATAPVGTATPANPAVPAATGNGTAAQPTPART